MVLALSAAVAGQAQPTTTSTSTPFTSVIGSTCAGEVIDVSGNLHRLQHSVTNRQGLVSTVIHLNITGTGVGQVTGEHYVFTQTSTESFNNRAGAPLAATTRKRFT